MANERLLHTMIRVRDLDRSIQFYCEVLGMRMLRRKEYPEGQFTLVFVGYGEEKESHVIELTYNWDNREYEMGTAFGHIAIGTTDVAQMCAQVRSHGGKVTREPGPMKHGTTILAFVEDPDGYKIELLQK